VRFYQSDGFFNIEDDGSIVYEAVQELQALADKFSTNLFIGTVRELQVIGEVGVHHNSGLVINSSGEIVQLRRKIHGTDAHKIIDPKYQGLDFWSHNTGHPKYRIPKEGVRFADSRMNTVAEAVQAALDTLRPVKLISKRGDSFTLLGIICSERADISLVDRINERDIDTVGVSAREGDDWFTERSQVLLYGNILEPEESHLAGGIEFFTDPISVEGWTMGKWMQKSVERGVVRQGSAWIASDAAIGGQVGVFSPLGSGVIKETNYAEDVLIAKCDLPA
jgi:hypothetical protein